jgi:hypothetical protein
MQERIGFHGCSTRSLSSRLHQREQAIATPRMRKLRACRIREQAASDKPVAAAIYASENASSFDAISRMNQVSSHRAGCSRAQLRGPLPIGGGHA